MKIRPILNKREARIPFTKEGYQKILEEKSQLLAERPEAVEHLRKAREMGDLSENGYYKAARARLSFLDARIRRIERLVKLGKIIEPSSEDTIEIGSTVCLSDGANDYEYTVVGGFESNPAEHTISHQSPLGRALVGRKVGDVAEVHAPAGTKRYTITRIFIR